MEDRAYQNALRRREKLKKELADVDLFISLYQMFKGDSTTVEAAPKPLPPAPPKPRVKTSTRQRRGLAKETLSPIIKDILMAHGRPMTRGHLVNALRSRDISITGTNPGKNMGTTMWRLRNEFINIEGQGYWPVDEPCEAVGYKPGATNSDDEITLDKLMG